MTNNKQFDVLFRYTIKPGKEALFQSYLDKVLPVTKAEEPYVLEYQIFRDEDGSFLQHERYMDEASVAKHLEVTADGQADFHASVDLIEVRAIGEFTMSFWEEYEGPHFFRYSRYREVTR